MSPDIKVHLDEEELTVLEHRGVLLMLEHDNHDIVQLRGILCLTDTQATIALCVRSISYFQTDELIHIVFRFSEHLKWQLVYDGEKDHARIRFFLELKLKDLIP